MTDLVKACESADLVAEVIERSSMVKVSSPGAHPRMAETITLRPGVDDVLTWFWSWGEPISPAEDLTRVVELLAHVVSAREF